MNKYILLFLALALTATLSSCGRMNKPEKPDGSVYQRTYY